MMENYGKKSVIDFNTALAPNGDALSEMLAAYADVDVPADDENYYFLENTLRFSLGELYCESMGETCTHVKKAGRMAFGHSSFLFIANA